MSEAGSEHLATVTNTWLGLTFLVLVPGVLASSAGTSPAMSQVLGLLLVIAYALVRRNGLSAGGPAPLRAALWRYLPFLAIWAPFTFVVYPRIVHALGGVLPAQIILQQLAAGSTETRAWIILLACILAPIGEEVVFRGYLFGAIIRGRLGRVRQGRRWTILITALLFGILHGWPYFVPISLIGLLLGWLRASTGGIAAPIAAHMLHNSLTVVVTLVWPDFLELVFDKR